MSEYTKGPWKEDGTEYCHRLSHGVVNGDEDVVIAHCDSENLSLIAAAPELYEALKRAQMFIKNGIEAGYIQMPDADCPDPAHGTLPTIDAALSKANGESQ